jgi:hypothetical protein
MAPPDMEQDIDQDIEQELEPAAAQTRDGELGLEIGYQARPQFRAFHERRERFACIVAHPPIFLSADPSTSLSPPATFPNAFGQFPPAVNALPTDFGTGGILGGLAKIAAEQARANDPRYGPATGILAGVAKQVADQAAANDLLSAAAIPGILRAVANLQPAASKAQAAPSSLPTSARFLPPDPIGFPGASNLDGYAENDPLNRGDSTGFAAVSGLAPSNPDRARDTPETLGSQYYGYGQAEGFPTQVSPDVTRPPIRLVNDNESTAEEKSGAPPLDHDHLKSAPSRALNPFGEENSIAGRSGWGAGTPAPSRAGPPPAPPAQAPQPLPRPSPPPPAAPPPGALPSPSLGRAATSPQPASAPIEPESVTPPNHESDRSGGSPPNPPSGIGPGPYAVERIPAGPGKRPNTTQRDQINDSGDRYGCHTCGAPEPGTRSGNWIGDHQTSTALNPPGQQQYFLPHCQSCSLRQGGLLQNFIRRWRK